MNSGKKRIAILLRDLDGGGAERSMIAIANGLSVSDMEVHLVLFSAHGPFKKYVADSITVHSLDTKESKGLSAIWAVIPMIRCLKQLSPELVLSTLEATTIVGSISLRFQRLSPDFAIRVATTFSKEKRRMLRSLIVKQLYRRHRGKFITNSVGSKEDLATSLGIRRSRIEVIENGVDLELINELAAAPIDSEIGNRKEQFFLNIGRLSVSKRQDLLIRAFAQISDDIPHNLVILGEGPMLGQLRQLVSKLGLQDRVFMPGFAENPYPYFKKALAFVLSSDYEGMPTVVIEALACNCPVISTDCPSGPSEILSDGKWGKLVKVGDADGLAKSMLQINPESRDKLRLVERASDFSTQVMCQKYRELINEIL